MFFLPRIIRKLSFKPLSSSKSLPTSHRKTDKINWTLPAKYVWVSDQSSIPMFCLKKLISQPREVQNPPNLTQGTLTQYILRLVIFRPHPTPPIYLKMPKCAKFCTFGESRFKHTPKVGVHRENLLMGNVAQTFLGAFYICWDYVISFSQHFPMRKFSPSPSTSPSPESHLLLQNWLKFRK